MSETQANEANARQRIILCMDGTWDDIDSNTNVFRWFNHINTSPHTDGDEQWIQIREYFNGAGLTSTGQRDPVGAATGEGVDAQILNAYQFIGNNIRDYEKDQVWVIGFSRGAYAARSLVGMLHNVGMLPPHEMSVQNVNAAYEFYRDRSPETTPESPQAIQFREKHECQNPRIRFLGCFDTVGSLGIPKLGDTFGEGLLNEQYRFHDTNISPYVESAIHAISIHEQRKWFEPVFMDYAESPKYSQELIQVWFPGVHQDVGGGSDAGEAETWVLPNKSLQWMMEMAQQRGFVFTEPIQDICRGDNFIFHDPYRKNIIYHLVPREDRVIDPQRFAPQRMNAVYESGNFSYISQADLAQYSSHTLDNYRDYLSNHTLISSNTNT